MKTLLRDIWSAAKSALVAAFGSKKFLAMLSAGVVQGITSLLAWLHISGIQLDQTAVDRYIAVVAAYVLAQGIADHGKSAAIENAKTVQAMDPTPPAEVHS